MVRAKASHRKARTAKGINGKNRSGRKFLLDMKRGVSI